MTSTNIAGRDRFDLRRWRGAGRSGRERPPGFAYAATAPIFIIVAAVVAVPLAYSVWLSLHRSNPITRTQNFVGLDNFAAVLTDPELWAAFGRTAYFGAFSLVGTTLIGMGMALVLNQRFPGRGFLRSVMLVPWAMAPVSIGVFFSFFYAGGGGTLNGLLHDLGLGSLATAWLGNGPRALTLVALTHVWNQAPLTALMLLAGLQSMPANLHRAAMLDGAGPVARFFAITLPWLKPSLLFVSIIATINALMAFDILWIMTSGGPGQATTVFAWLGYVVSFQFLRFGEGAAILYLLTGLSFVMALTYVLVLSPRQRTARPANGADEGVLLGGGLTARTRRPAELERAPPRRRLLSRSASERLGKAGFWTAALLVFVWSAVPIIMLVIMSMMPASDLIRIPPSMIPTDLTLDNFRTVLLPETGGETVSVQAKRVPLSLMNSFIVAAAVVAITAALAPFAGYVFARWPKATSFRIGLWALLMTRMTPALTLVLPFFVIYRMLDLIDTRSGLVIAYLSILLPLTAWMMKTTFEGVPRSLDRAAIVDGCSRFDMMRRVLLPVVRPGVVAAAIFAFLVCWNEFLFALILTSTPKAQTITVVLSGFLQQARFYEYGPMFAASVLSVLPPVLIAFVFQRYLVQGALAGAVKG